MIKKVGQRKRATSDPAAAERLIGPEPTLSLSRRGGVDDWLVGRTYRVRARCGNGGKVFWKMIGYPGLPATLARDMVEFRDKRRSRRKRLRPRIMGSRRVLHAPRFVLTGESKGRNLIRRCRLIT